MARNDVRIKDAPDIIAAGLADIVCFARDPLGFTDNYELWDCQVEWLTQFQEAYMEYRRDPVRGRYLCILGPSEHGKTYGLNVPAALWVLARNPNARIGILGSNEEAAEGIGYVIDKLFKNHAKDLAKYGLIPGWPWNATSKYVKRSDDKIIDPSIFCFGPKSDVQGKRFDLLLCCDLFTRVNQSTYKKRKELLDFFDEVLEHRMEDDGFIMSDGHMVAPEDNYRAFENDTENWKVLTYSAILEEPCEANGGRGKVLVPHKWSFEKLAKKRRKNARIFQLMFQNKRVAAATYVQREAFEQCLDISRPLVPTLPNEIRYLYDYIYMCHDPAFTINRRSAFSVIQIWGVAKDHEVLIGGWREKLLPNQLKARVKATFFCFLPDYFYIECNAQQSYYVNDIRDNLIEFKERIRPVYTEDNDITNSIDHGISALVDGVQSGFYRFPYLDQNAKDLSEQYYNELVSYPAKPDDVIKCHHIGKQGERERLGGTQDRNCIIMKQSFTRSVARQVHGSRGTPLIGPDAIIIRFKRYG